MQRIAAVFHLHTFISQVCPVVHRTLVAEVIFLGEHGHGRSFNHHHQFCVRLCDNSFNGDDAERNIRRDSRLEIHDHF